jgi:predicted TIM-barrel fold metal-dependent hydrolase
MEKTMTAATAVDVHQHLLPEQLVDRLRARTHAPYLRGWTLHTPGERPASVDPAAHDVAARVATDEDDGVAVSCLSLPALGIEHLPRPEATTLVAAWHAGARSLSPHFRAWAAVPALDPDPGELRSLLAEGFIGVQLPAVDLASPAAWERAGDLLAVAEAAGAPVLVHPGPQPASPLDGPLPGWWSPVVASSAQLQAAWWAWQAVAGRTLFPSLRVVFAAGAGLAPVHHERHRVFGGTQQTVDRDVFVDTAATGAQALDALVRVLGIDVLVLGSDRPDAVPLARQPLDRTFGDAATQAIRNTNPRRLLDVEQHAHPAQKETRTWPRAS